MTRVLGIVGSPRKKGNTELLVESVLAGAEVHGAATEKVCLAGLELKECDGCHVCWQGKDCPKHDDINGLYGLIAASDVLVFGTPVYWYGPTGLMKLLIDRLVYFNCPANRKKIAGKAAAIAVPFEEDNREAAWLLTEFFAKCFAYLELRSAGQVLAPGVTKKGEIADNTDILRQAYELGESLVG